MGSLMNWPPSFWDRFSNPKRRPRHDAISPPGAIDLNRARAMKANRSDIGVITSKSGDYMEGDIHAIKRNMAIYEALKLAVTVNENGTCYYKNGQSDKDLAAELGVAQGTVAYVRRELFGTIEKPLISSEKTIEERMELLERMMEQLRLSVVTELDKLRAPRGQL